MNVPSKLVLGLCFVALAGLNGCGSDDAVSGPSGRLVQGPVLNATVFADNVSAGTRFVQDSNEVTTTTDSVTGDFRLPSVPGYNYVLVSKGGTDKLTNQPAIQMIAPAGSANITPLTTLVALDTTGAVKAKLEQLMPAGVKFDTDISINASSAVLLVVKSVETIVQTMTKAVDTKAGAGNVSGDQMAVIQGQAMQAIAVEFAKSSVTATTMSAPATLSVTLQTAATGAVASINSTNANINIPSATAIAIASSAVSASATALNVSTTATAAAIVGGENAAISLHASQGFVAAVNNASDTAVAAITAAGTPAIYHPPVVPVVTPVTVPNTTGTTGGTSGGTGVTF